MLVRRTQLHTPSTSRSYQHRLQYLYARRMALDTLIESMEQYAKCRARRLAGLRMKTV
jgi:hypothetical protein